MEAHRRIIVLIVTTSLMLLGPTEAGFSSSSSWKKMFGTPTASFPEKTNNGGTVNNNNGDGNVYYTGGRRNSEGYYETESWTGEAYQLTRHRLMENQKCTEEMNLVWNGEKVGKTFKPKCLKNGRITITFYGKGVLILGSPNEDFCAFSSRKNEYFYKQDGKWTKGNINDNQINEADMNPTEIKKVTDRMIKWKEVIDKFISNEKIIAEKQMKEGQRISVELHRIQNLMNTEGWSNQRKLEELGKQRFAELHKQGEEQAKINRIASYHGWSADLHRAQIEMENKAQQVENEIQSKESAENSRYMQVMQELNNQMVRENEKHQLEMHNLHQQYNQEYARFDRECQEMIKQGY